MHAESSSSTALPRERSAERSLAGVSADAAASKDLAAAERSAAPFAALPFVGARRMRGRIRGLA